jgi:hypothetical protein
MRTFRYSKEFPEGKVFDTTGETAPYPPTELSGWFDCRSKIHVTQDQLIDAVVRRELSKQDPHRIELEREFKAKTGATPAATAKDSTLIKVLDEPLARRRK